MKNQAGDYRAIHYFLVVAEELHFGRAAQRLRIAQPPLSQQIRRLEDRIGHRLFSRHPKVSLTSAGRVLYDSALGPLAQVRQALKSARLAGEGKAGNLSVGFAASVLLKDLPVVIRRFRQQHPEIRLSLREWPTAHLAEELRSDRIELGFLREPEETAGLVCEEIVEEPFVAVLPADHPLAARRTVTIPTLAREPFVHFPREMSPGLFRQVNLLFDRSGVAPKVVQEAQEWMTIVGLVEAGLGVSLVPESFRKLRWGRVIYRPLRGTVVRTTIALCRKDGAPLSAAGSRFVDMFRKKIGSEI